MSTGKAANSPTSEAVMNMLSKFRYTGFEWCWLLPGISKEKKKTEHLFQKISSKQELEEIKKSNCGLP